MLLMVWDLVKEVPSKLLGVKGTLSKNSAPVAILNQCWQAVLLSQDSDGPGGHGFSSSCQDRLEYFIHRQRRGPM